VKEWFRQSGRDNLVEPKGPAPAHVLFESFIILAHYKQEFSKWSEQSKDRMGYFEEQRVGGT
jgi:hypothetical protein